MAEIIEKIRNIMKQLGFEYLNYERLNMTFEKIDIKINKNIRKLELDNEFK